MGLTDFVGQGVDYPMRFDEQGRLSLVGGTLNVDRAIALIIGTAYGERPMRPEFGCGIHALIFETPSPELSTQIQAQVTASLKRWEPRIDVVSVGVKFDNENTTANILVTYRLKDTYDVRNLLVPFYLIPNEDERLPHLPQLPQESP
jgi:phage baseplate assembly protein W